MSLDLDAPIICALEIAADDDVKMANLYKALFVSVRKLSDDYQATEEFNTIISNILEDSILEQDINIHIYQMTQLWIKLRSKVKKK